TNGVHVPTWQDPRIGAARGAPDALWAAHQALKRETVEDVAARTGVRLDPDVLTLGFARRAAGYKRADLIFSDPARIEPLLVGRLQLVFAGKAHPDDGEGRRLVATLFAMARRYPRAVVFVPDYDMALLRRPRARDLARLGRPRALARHDGGEDRGGGGAVLGGADGARVLRAALRALKGRQATRVRRRSPPRRARPIPRAHRPRAAAPAPHRRGDARPCAQP